jgi:hypothetical protein
MDIWSFMDKGEPDVRSKLCQEKWKLPIHRSRLLPFIISTLYSLTIFSQNYKWGFSFLQLLICLVLLFIWTAGIYIMWLRAYFTMKARECDPSDISGEYRAVIELATAMQFELSSIKVDPHNLTEEQLSRKINKDIKGGAISYAYTTAKPRTYNYTKRLRSWIIREIWWLLAMLLTSTWAALAFLRYHKLLKPLSLFFWLSGVWLGQFWAMCIGTTRGSRLLIIWFCALTSAAISLLRWYLIRHETN